MSKIFTPEQIKLREHSEITERIIRSC